MKKITAIVVILAAAVVLFYAKPWHKSNLALYAAASNDMLALSCNTLSGTLKAKELGVKRFAVDITFTGDTLVTSDGTFQKYFDAAGRDMELIWLNILNLSTENSAYVYDIINSMDILQEHTLIESRSPEGMAIFEQNGWHTIYTIDKDDVLAVVADEIRKYNISGVSYPVEMDEYVRSWIADINYYGQASFPKGLTIYPHLLGIRVALAK